MRCSINGKAIAAFATFCTVLVYLAVGAAIFQAIEESHENEQRQNYEQQLHELLKDVDENFHAELKAPCHMVEVLEAKPNVTNTWTFAPTVIFCLTVVTTIGYTMRCSINGKAIAAFATFCTVLVYLAVGAAIFQAIEESHENEQRQNYEQQLHELLKDVDENFHAELKAPCHMVEVLEAKPNVTNTWTFAPTVIFCLTVVTTIGYGYMYPGLFMACLAVYAQHTANFIRWVCKKLRSIMGGQEEENETVQQIVTVLFCLLVILTFSAYLSYKEKWSYFDSIYFTFISFTTIGFGVHQAMIGRGSLERPESNTECVCCGLPWVPLSVSYHGYHYRLVTMVTIIGYGYMYPVTDEGRGFCIFFALIGIPLFMACLAVYAQHTANFIRWVCKKLRSIMGGQEEENETVQQIVTVLFCLLVILTFSAYLSYKEKWSYFDSIYFTFISFTTIGFGVGIAQFIHNLLQYHFKLNFTLLNFGLEMGITTPFLKPGRYVTVLNKMNLFSDLYPESSDTLFYFLFVFFIILGLISLGTVIEAQTTNFSKFLTFISNTCECMCGKCLTVEKDTMSEYDQDEVNHTKAIHDNKRVRSPAEY
eukprot:sb/3463269/